MLNKNFNKIRSAARFSKSVDVLVATVIKSSVTIVVKVTKGADAAVKCVRKLRTLAHCSVCEERTFLPNNDGFLLDDVGKYLSCDCASKSVGRTVMALGPLWSGAIGSPSFADSMLPQAIVSVHLTTFLQALVAELRCDDNSMKEKNGTQENAEASLFVDGTLSKSSGKGSFPASNLKRKCEDSCDQGAEGKRLCLRPCSDPEPAPAFYYNLHKHKPKGCQKLLKVDKIINKLHQLGFRASRSHFDRAAIKTNCPLRILQSSLYQET